MLSYMYVTIMLYYFMLIVYVNYRCFLCNPFLLHLLIGINLFLQLKTRNKREDLMVGLTDKMNK